MLLKKRYLLSILTSLICICLCSCTTTLLLSHPQTPTYEGKNVNTFSENDLIKKIFKEKQNPKIVLRVPAPTKDITSAEMSKQNETYNLIEKILFEAGFTIRDRALLNNLLNKSESLDYKALGQKIDTDLILEVVDLNLNLKYYYSAPFANIEIIESGDCASSYQQGSYCLVAYTAYLEFRLIAVEAGEVGGFYTLLASPCENKPCKFFIESDCNIYYYVDNSGKRRSDGARFSSMEEAINALMYKFVEHIKSIHNQQEVQASEPTVAPKPAEPSTTTISPATDEKKEGSCKTNEDCPGIMYCTSWGECKEACKSDSDCPESLKCSSFGECLSK